MAQAIMQSLCAVVVMSSPVPIATVFSLCTNTERILMKFAGGNHCTQYCHELITFRAKLYRDQGSRNGYNRTFESTSNWCCHVVNDLYGFCSTYGTLRLQGWRVHYTHAPAEALYDRAVFSSVVLCSLTQARARNTPWLKEPFRSDSHTILSNYRPKY